MQRNSSDGEAPSGVDDPESVGSGVSATSEPVVVEPEVVQPARMRDEARLERLGCLSGATAPSVGSLTSG